jgi:hypothetical protein
MSAGKISALRKRAYQEERKRKEGQKPASGGFFASVL